VNSTVKAGWDIPGGMHLLCPQHSEIIKRTLGRSVMDLDERVESLFAGREFYDHRNP